MSRYPEKKNSLPDLLSEELNSEDHHLLRLIASNSKNDIPSNKQELLSTCALSLFGCKLTTLPSSLSLLEKMIELDCRCNQFQVVPDPLLELSQLKSLVLSENAL